MDPVGWTRCRGATQVRGLLMKVLVVDRRQVPELARSSDGLSRAELA